MRPKPVLVMSTVSAVVLVLAGRASQLPAISLRTQGLGIVSTPATGQQPATHPVAAGAAPGPRAPSARPSASRTATAQGYQPIPTTHAPTTPVRAPTSKAPAPRNGSTPTRTTPTPAASKTVTVNGAPADTQYGPVQVQITLRGGHLVSSNAIVYPQGSSRDQEINSQAIPQLNDEAVQADSARIDTVSGATYTSDGYRASLQSALDTAHNAGYR